MPVLGYLPIASMVDGVHTGIYTINTVAASWEPWTSAVLKRSCIGLRIELNSELRELFRQEGKGSQLLTKAAVLRAAIDVWSPSSNEQSGESDNNFISMQISQQISRFVVVHFP